MTRLPTAITQDDVNRLLAQISLAPDGVVAGLTPPDSVPDPIGWDDDNNPVWPSDFKPEELPDDSVWDQYTALSDRAHAGGGGPVLAIIVDAVNEPSRPDVIARAAALYEVVEAGKGPRATLFSGDRLRAMSEFERATLHVRTDRRSTWFVCAYLGVDEHQALVVRQLAIEPEAPGMSIVTSEILRKISVPALIARARAMIAVSPEWLEFLSRNTSVSFPKDELDEARRLAGRVDDRQRRTGRPGHSEDRLRWIANEYVRLWQDGRIKGIRRDLCIGYERKFQERLTPRQMADRIERARELGFLTRPGRQGQVGGELGPNYSPSL